MQVFYRKTQSGWLILFSLIPVLVFLAFLLYRQQIWGRSFGEEASPFWLFPVLLVFFFILLALFATLTVTGFQDHLEIKFGIGLIRKRFYYKDIRSCSAKKNSFIYGWGIRAIPGGWLYNVSGLWSVQLDMKSGKIYRVGTAEPEKLEQFIRSRLSLYAGS
jgi:hypothetical protein